MMPLLPPGWPRPKGYSNGYCASGRLVVTAGVVGWDAQENFTSDTLPGQFAQALRNILAIIAEGGAGPAHLVRMTCYVTSIDAYTASLAEIGAAWRDVCHVFARRWPLARRRCGRCPPRMRHATRRRPKRPRWTS